MNLPLVHEVFTSVKSLGRAVVGDVEGARNEWHQYAESSIVGSGVYSAVTAISGDTERATEIAKGMGKAAVNPLGGLGGTIPLFHEVNTSLDSLGDFLIDQDPELARKRWDHYAENSVVGSGVYAGVLAANGDTDGATEVAKGMGKATATAAIGVASVAATVGTAGLAAPALGLGYASTIAATAAMGAATGSGANLATKAIHGQELDAGDAVGDGMIGAMGGAAVGLKFAKAARAARAAARVNPPIHPDFPMDNDTFRIMNEFLDADDLNALRMVDERAVEPLLRQQFRELRAELDALDRTSQRLNEQAAQFYR